jgi:hypothetical protein
MPTAIEITCTRSATDDSPLWLVGLAGRTQFQRRSVECVCDVVDLLGAKYPTLPVVIVTR